MKHKVKTQIAATFIGLMLIALHEIVQRMIRRHLSERKAA